MAFLEWHRWLNVPIISTTLVCLLMIATVTHAADNAACDLFQIFNCSQSYQDNPRPYWLMSSDPLQPKPHEITKWIIQSQGILVSNGWTLRDFRPVESYRLTCVKSISDASQKRILFVLNQNMGDELHKYVCVGITLRGPIVFQVKISKIREASDTSTVMGLCNDNSLLDTGMTFVNFEDPVTGWDNYIQDLVYYLPCPIGGGYEITSWEDERGMTECGEPGKGKLRVEDECEAGDGVVFSKSTSQDCKNPFAGEIYEDTHMRCFSRWEDEHFEYGIALAEFTNSVYCIRSPKKESENKVYFFKDGICDPTSDILHSKKYVVMNLLQDTIQSACHDIIHWCITYFASNPSQIEELMNLCPENAEDCQSILFWRNITTPEQIQGDWFYETLPLGTDNIQVSESLIKSARLGEWRFAGESDCAIETHGLQGQGKFYFLISVREDGCQPRVSLMWLKPTSKSVQIFQLSHGVVIKAGTSAITPASLCDYIFHFGQSNQILNDRYHVEAFEWYNLVNTDESLPLNNCDISEWKHLQVTLRGGQSCTVSLQQDGPTRFSTTVHDCNKPVNGISLKKPIHHDCLALYKGEHGWVSFLITRTPEGETNLAKRKYICWLFEENRGLIMPVGDCNDETIAKVLDEKSEVPLVELRLTKAVIGSGICLKSSMTLTILVFIMNLLSRAS